MQYQVHTREYQLQTGEWIPQAQVWVVIPGGIEATQISSSRDVRFATREEARAHSERLGQQAANKMLF
jgi:hypothetical protein